MARKSTAHLKRASTYQSKGASAPLDDTTWYAPPGWVLVPEKPTVGWIKRLRARTSYAQAEKAISLIIATAPRIAHTTIERDNEDT